MMLPSEKATQIVKDRGKQYGHPWDVHSRVASMWTGLFGWEVSVEDVAQALQCVKLAREKQADYPYEYTDNVDDQAGYANVLALIKEARHESTTPAGDGTDGASGVAEEELSRPKPRADRSRVRRGSGRARAPRS